MRAVRDVVVAFNNAITTHDLDRLAALMRDDHRFIEASHHHRAQRCGQSR